MEKKFGPKNRKNIFWSRLRLAPKKLVPNFWREIHVPGISLISHRGRSTRCSLASTRFFNPEFVVRSQHFLFFATSWPRPLFCSRGFLARSLLMKLVLPNPAQSGEVFYFHVTGREARTSGTCCTSWLVDLHSNHCATIMKLFTAS